MKKLSSLLLLLFSITAQASWEKLEPGLELGTFQSPAYADSIKAFVRVLRIDPKRFDLRLLNSSEPSQGKLLSAAQWCRKEKLVAAINASMYQTDYKTSVSLMKTSQHINNARISKDKTILAFNRNDAAVPTVKIIDKQCDDFTQWKPKYSTFVQSIRMISCSGKNVWNQGLQPWSIAAIGTDTRGYILLIISVTPHTVHDFNNALKKMPIDIDRVMYLEGAHIAQLAINTCKKKFELIGQYTALGYSPTEAPSIPNVIGVVRKSK
jgi:uncharacterized protein YigE (DUF2233 family)